MQLESVRSLGYRTDLSLLLRTGSTLTDRGDHLVVRTDDNPTFWWGNYLLLGAALAPEETADWVRRFGAEFPRARHRALGVDDPTLGGEDVPGFAGAGFSVEVDTVMTATAVRPPALPNAEAAYRPLTSDADWEQSAQLALSGRPDVAARERDRAFSTARSLAHRRMAASGAGRWFGAFLGGRLVAQMGLVSASPRLARFQDVETHPEFRRRGLAATLVHHVSGYGFGELSARTLVIVADPGYPAIGIYRALGFTVHERQVGMSRAPED